MAALVSGLLGHVTHAITPVNPYVPIHTTCPTGPLIQPASAGLSHNEASYADARYSVASSNLQTWLSGTGAGFSHVDKYPRLAISFSGGGYRAQLSGAGVRKGFDARDNSKSSVAGLYQAFTYESGLSGGSWLLGSISGNNYPTISHLQDTLWGPNAEAGILLPDGLLVAVADLGIVTDVAAKEAAGFQTTIVDIWGRLQGYAFLDGHDGGVKTLLSDVASSPNFTTHDVPFPILTALGVDDTTASCQASENSTQFEFTPYTFGSWDKAVRAFVPTKYLGTSLNAGETGSSCVTRYDNLGYVMGTSSDIFASAFCGLVTTGQDISTAKAPGASLLGLLSNLTSGIRNDSATYVAGTYPNPFFNLNGVSAPYATQKQLDLVDGGTGGQNDPIWPFLYRPEVDVLFVNDNSADTNNNYPNGTEIYQTHLYAQALGLSRMPTIPSPDEFVARGWDGKPGFFGCNETNALTIVWLPNHDWIYNSGTSTFKLQYSRDESNGLINNGVAVGNFNGTKGWDVCVGCAVLKKSTTKLPAACQKCFADYCWS